ncbi:MAG: tRNA lysidine(34) synthetase TilS [Alphaproteobacteria bacterium]|nr:tRNA lysidine(34) synthetase TilS [Alphaproteobacteria bacterium]
MTLALNFIDKDESTDFFCREMEKLSIFCNDTYGIRFSKICVGVSGGADSLALLFFTKKWADAHNVNLYCVTVDHQLRKESAEEARFVKDICRANGIYHETLVWAHGKLDFPHTKLENKAREARYNLLAEFCKQNGIHILMTAHHWNDQLETYEMRRFFNSSESGLAAMSQVRSLTSDILLVRPLLHFSKKHLQDFLKPKHIIWKEDPMNTQAEFLRVSYRRKILSYDDKKISEMSSELLRLGALRNAIEIVAVRFLKQFCEFTEYGYAVINKEKIFQENDLVQREILKRVIWNIGGKKYAMSISQMLLRKILSGKTNTFGRCFIKFKKDKIYVFRENRNIPSIVAKISSLKWDNRFLINFNEELNDFIVQSARSSEDLNIPREACAGYPQLYRQDDNGIHDKKNYDIVFMNKINLFDIFV